MTAPPLSAVSILFMALLSACGGGSPCAHFPYATGPTQPCGNQCSATNVDPANCGGCGKVCAAKAICAGGICAACRGSLSGALSETFDCTVSISSFDGQGTFAIAAPETSLRIDVFRGAQAGSTFTSATGVVANVTTSAGSWDANRQAGSAAITFSAVDVASQTSPCCPNYVAHGSASATLVGSGSDIAMAISF